MGQSSSGSEVQGDAALSPRHADRVPGPVRLAVAAHVGRRHRRGRALGSSAENGRRRARSARHPRADRCRARSGDALPLSARILRRPAPAHRDRARHGAGADIRRARRADQRARHADPGADRRSAARPAEAAQSHLSVHLARSARGRGAGKPADRHARTARWWRKARRRTCSSNRRATTPARCSPPPSISKPPPRAWWRSSAPDRSHVRQRHSCCRCRRKREGVGRSFA